MTNDILLIKVKQRLNKLSSGDYDNLERWEVLEAVNKAQYEVVRDEIYNAEHDIKRIDAFNILLKQESLKGSNSEIYFESLTLPEDFLAYKRIDILASNDKCGNSRWMTSYLVEEAEINTLLRNPLKNPSWEWAETINTLIGNKVRVYTNEQFKVESLRITYYRLPAAVTISGSPDMTRAGLNATKEQTLEFRQTINELIIDKAASILAGDMDNFNQMQRLGSERI